VRQRQRQEQVEQLLSGRPLPRTLGNTPEALAHLQAVVEDAIAVARLLAVIAAEARSGNWRAASWLLTNVHGVNPKEHSG
jgi:hypothetical protein